MGTDILDHDFSEKSGPPSRIEYAGFWLRLGAMIIDFLILSPLTFITYYNSINHKSLSIMLITTLASFLYKPYLEWKKGATFGKTALGIKIVDYSFEDIDQSQAIARYFPWIISFLFGTATNIWLYLKPEFQYAETFTNVAILTQSSPFITYTHLYSVVFVILVGSLIFSSKRQGFHDKYAETYCIRVN